MRRSAGDRKRRHARRTATQPTMAAFQISIKPRFAVSWVVCVPQAASPSQHCRFPSCALALNSAELRELDRGQHLQIFLRSFGFCFSSESFFIGLLAELCGLEPGPLLVRRRSAARRSQRCNTRTVFDPMVPASTPAADVLGGSRSGHGLGRSAQHHTRVPCPVCIQ